MMNTNNRPNRIMVRFHFEISTPHVNIIFVLTEEQISRYASQSYIVTDTSRARASNKEIELFRRQLLTPPVNVIESVLSEEEITRSPWSITVLTNLPLRYTANIAGMVYEGHLASYEGLVNVYPTIATPVHIVSVETVFTEEDITRHLESTFVFSGLLLEHNSFFEKQL